MNFKNDLPFLRKGFELPQTWFCGGRIGAAVGSHGGLSKVIYCGRQSLDGIDFFQGDAVAAWTKLFRLCVVIDHVPYHPAFNNTTLHPFGYRSECTLGGVRFRHELALLNDAVIQRVCLLKKPRHLRVSLRLVFHGDPASVNRDYRTWTGFAPLKGVHAFACRATDRRKYPKKNGKEKVPFTQTAAYGAHDVENAETFIAVGSDHSAVFTAHHGGFKYHLDTKPINKTGAFFLCFSGDQPSLTRRVKELRKSLHRECNAKFSPAKGGSPTVRVPNKALQSFLAQLPGVVEALRVADIPGGMRASAGHYWVWGWDSMVYSKGLMLGGHAEFVRQMLQFYKGLADQKFGIPHAMTTQLTPLMAMAFPAQGLYSVMLYNYFCATRDLATLRRYFPFARWIVEQAMTREIHGAGLIDGASLFPDFPELLGHDGHDLSVFNNSIFYQALLVTRDLAATLARKVGDRGRGLREFVVRLEAMADRCRGNFTKVFFDKKAGYFVDSASSINFTRRRCHPSYAILWVTPYAADLVDANLRRIASFMSSKFSNPRGIFHFPVEEKAFLSDGNQCSAYYPVIEPFYRNVMSLAGRQKEIERWPEIVEWYWRRNTIPEGLTFDAANAGDLTPDCPGGKQPFAGKAWYELFFTAYAGIDFNIKGLIVRPTPVTAPIEIDRLVVNNRPLRVRITGAGDGLRATLNGKLLPEPVLIPLDTLRKDRNTLLVTRTSSKN